jgi:hypothetical protein
MCEFDWHNVGFKKKLDISGDIKLLNDFERGLPILFLLDENHNDTVSITKNVENALQLVSDASVVIIGVETYAGGKEWCRETQNYVTDDVNEKEYRELDIPSHTNSYPQFADTIKKQHPDKIYGVESIGMFNKIIEESSMVEKTERDEFVNSHKLHFERSKHFIKSLFEDFVSINTTGNLILNCGSDHNNHIESWIKDGSIDEISKFKANYIRINTFSNQREVG